MKNKILLFLLSILLVFIIGTFSIISQNQFLNSFEKKIPNNFKTFLKNTIFFIPSTIKNNQILSKKNTQLEFEKKKIYEIINSFNNLNSGKFIDRRSLVSDKGIKFISSSFFLPYVFNKGTDNIDLSINLSSSRKSSNILRHKDNVYIFFSSGKIINFQYKNYIQNNDKINFKEINSNLDDFSGPSEYYWSGIKDVILVENNIFVSYVSGIHECYNISILKADINDFIFEEFFQPSECIDQKNNLNFDGSPINGEFAGIQAGGKMIRYDDTNILLSIGDFRIRNLAQKKDSIFGKIISINLKNKNFNVVSMGHRNPQGMILQENTNEKYILSAEHGPKGGDEINLIKLNNANEIPNFGWPISSYGEHYDGKFRKDSPLYKSHSKYGFNEPIYYFKRSRLGVNQIIYSKKIIKNSSEKNYFVTSLNGKTIFIFENNLEEKNFKMIDKVYYGKRIRDIEIIDDIIIITDESYTPSINFLMIESD